MTGQCVPLVVTTPRGNGPWQEIQGQMDRSVVLITGASRGIGRATARLLAERGYRVIGTARKPSGLAPMASRCCRWMSPRMSR